jgi:uncharacterized membrane protein YbhN (UPF0104 family)
MSCRLYRRPSTWTTVRVVVGILLVAVLVATLDLRSIVTRMQMANLWLVLFAITGLTLDHALAGVAWREISRLVRAATMPWWAAIRSYYIAQGFGGLTPGNVGGDAYRVLALRRDGQNWSNSALPVLIQRATSFLALAALGAVGIAVLPMARAVGLPLLAVGVALALGLAVPIALLLLRRKHPLAALHELEAGTTVDRRAGVLPALTVGLVLGILFHAVGIALAYVLVIAVDPGIGSPAVLGALAIARLTIAIPLSPSGLGIQEGALALLFVGLGLPVETALAASLLGRLSLVSTTVIGMFLLSNGRSTQQEQPAPAQAL